MVSLQHQKWCHVDTKFSATTTLSATMTLYLISINSNNKINFIAKYGFYMLLMQHTFQIDNHIQ